MNMNNSIKRLAVLGQFIGITIILLISISANFLNASSDVALRIADNGKSTYRIVVPDDGIIAEKSAAEELVFYLKAISDTTFVIITESQHTSGPAIFVGQTKMTKKTIGAIDWNKMSGEDTVLWAAKDSIFIAGGRPRGTIYAVYTFLEEYCGIRWWTSADTDILKQRTLSITISNVVYHPPLRYREVYERDTRTRSEHDKTRKASGDPLFAARLKLNGATQDIPATHGGSMRIIGFVHTFYRLLPPEKYFKDHPEWYSEINGTRIFRNAQLCLTDEEMRKELVKNALEWIRKEPEAGIISISQNDWFNNCQCPKCKAIDDSEGTPSGSLIDFINKVAADIGKEYPDFLVETLAYYYSKKPPKTIRPASNVLIRIAPIEASYAKPMDSDMNSVFRDSIRAWGAIAPNIFIWDYSVYFYNYLLPFPAAQVWGPNFRFYASNNAVGIMAQGDSRNGDGSNQSGNFSALRTWVQSHLMWDPNRDPDALIREFANGYYGKAGPAIVEYLDIMHGALETAGFYLRCNLPDNAPYASIYSLADINSALNAFTRAEKDVAGDEVKTQRVKRDRLALDLICLLRQKELRSEAARSDQIFLGPTNLSDAIETYINSITNFGYSWIRETTKLPSYFPFLKSLARPEPTVPDEAKGRSIYEWSDFQDDGFEYYGPSGATITNDIQASDGYAGFLSSKTSDWGIKYWVGKNLENMTATGKWRIMATVRVLRNKGSGVAFSYGMYDMVGKSYPTERRKVSLDDIPTDEYHTYDIGNIPVKNGMYIWFAVNNENKSVEGILVDRIFVVKQP